MIKKMASKPGKDTEAEIKNQVTILSALLIANIDHNYSARIIHDLLPNIFSYR